MPPCRATVVLVTGMLGCLAALGAGAEAGPAGASTTCSADAVIRFDPGLTLVQRSQHIRVRGTLSDCVGGGVTSGTATGTGRGTGSCTSGSARATLTVTWNTGETSTIVGRVTLADEGVTITARVTEGRFAGEDVSAVLEAEPIEGDCFSTPLTQAAATGRLRI